MIIFKSKLTNKVFAWNEHTGLKPVSDDVDATLLDFVEQDVNFALVVWETPGGKSPESPEIRVFDYLNKSNDYDVIEWKNEPDPTMKIVY